MTLDLGYTMGWDNVAFTVSLTLNWSKNDQKKLLVIELTLINLK